MSRILYELCGKDDLRFSPWCWRARMALKRKGLDFETEPCTFSQIAEKLSFADYRFVPVLKDGETTVTDSWQIALYLEDTYKDAPTLFGGPAGLGLTRTIDSWIVSAVVPAIAGAIIYDVYQSVAEADRPYFKESREKRFGRPLEEFGAGQAETVERLRAALAPARAVMAKQPFLSGEEALYADFALFGPFQWARCSSPCELLADDDPLRDWRERMLDLYGGYARSAKSVAA